MIIKGNDVIGLKIFTLKQGAEIDNVSDLIYDPKSNKVRALLVDAGGWFSDAKLILYEDIKSIGKDAVMIDSADVIKKASDISERIAHIAKDDTYLTKTKIMTEDGTDLGSVSDIYFDDHSGQVMEFEVSQGLKNIQSGKKRVKVADIMTIGEDATIVRTYTEEQFEQQGQKQGLQGIVNKGKEKIENVQDTAQSPDTKQQAQDLIGSANHKLSQFNEKVRMKVDEMKEAPQTQQALETVKQKTQQAKAATDSKSQEATEKITEKRKKDALGKYLKVNILSPHDEMIAKQGDMITNEIVERAETYGLLDTILNNTSDQPINVV